MEAYLEAFAAAFDLEKYIRFNTPVLSLTPCEAGSPPRARLGSDTARTNGHRAGHQREVMPGTEEDRKGLVGLPNGHAAVNGTSNSRELPWPRWRVTTASTGDQVSTRHFLASIFSSAATPCFITV